VDCLRCAEFDVSTFRSDAGYFVVSPYPSPDWGRHREPDVSLCVGGCGVRPRPMQIALYGNRHPRVVKEGLQSTSPRRKMLPVSRRAVLYLGTCRLHMGPASRRIMGSCRSGGPSTRNATIEVCTVGHWQLPGAYSRELCANATMVRKGDYMCRSRYQRRM